MKSTERLYGVPPEKYADRQISLCREKIADAKALLHSMKDAHLKALKAQTSTPEVEDTLLRIDEIREAIRFNERLIQEVEERVK